MLVSGIQSCFLGEPEPSHKPIPGLPASLSLEYRQEEVLLDLSELNEIPPLA